VVVEAVLNVRWYDVLPGSRILERPALLQRSCRHLHIGIIRRRIPGPEDDVVLRRRETSGNKAVFRVHGFDKEIAALVLLEAIVTDASAVVRLLLH
jgi:hypothetical protein